MLYYVFHSKFTCFPLLVLIKKKSCTGRFDTNLKYVLSENVNINYLNAKILCQLNLLSKGVLSC